MFGMGIGELLLIFVIALLVFGPEKLPEVARTAGKLMRDLKRTSNDIRASIEEEINLKELQETLDLPKEVGRSMQDIVLPPAEVARRRRAKLRELKMRQQGAAAGNEPDTAEATTQTESAPSPPAPAAEPVGAGQTPETGSQANPEATHD